MNASLPTPPPLIPRRKHRAPWGISLLFHTALAAWIVLAPKSARIPAIGVIPIHFIISNPSPPVSAAPVPAKTTTPVPAPPVSVTPSAAPKDAIAPPSETPLPPQVTAEEQARYETPLMKFEERIAPAAPSAQTPPVKLLADASSSAVPVSAKTTGKPLIRKTAVPEQNAAAAASAPSSESGEEEKIKRLLERRSAKGVPQGALSDGAAEAKAMLDNRLRKVEMLRLIAPKQEKGGFKNDGAIRTVRFGGVPPEIEKDVFQRFGITRSSGLVTASDLKPGYLSGLELGGDQYRPATKPGYYDNIVGLSTAACRKMAEMEREWLIRHGHDPDRAILERVEFGIVQKQENFWDLDILEIRVKPRDFPVEMIFKH